MSGYNTKEVIKSGSAVTTTASSTTQVSNVFNISAGDSKNQLVSVTLTAVAETTGLSIALQDSPDGGTTWSSVQTANIGSVASVETLTFAAKAATGHGDYVVVYDTAGLGWAVAASTAGIKEVTSITAIAEGSVKEVTDITPVADVAGSLDGKTVILQDTAGSVGFWFDVAGGTTIPAAASACDRAVEVTTIVADDSATTIAGKLITAIDADAEFVAATGGGDVVRVTDAKYGARPAASASTSGFTVAEQTAGVDSALHLKTFIISDNAGTVGFWIDVDNAGGSIPAEATACDRAVEITTVNSAMTAAQVATVVAAAIDGDAEFVAPVPGAAIIAVTDASTGARADGSASTSGFTVSTTTQGAALGAAPSGAIWTAIDASRKGQADISGDTTAAQVAARFETAFDALTGFTAVITSDDSAANGTMTMTTVIGGIDTTNSVVKNTGDTGAGSISAAQTTAGSFTAVYELENNIYDGTDTALWPTARVAVVGGAGDIATVSSVIISRRL
jgi:hypothetical protein